MMPPRWRLRKINILSNPNGATGTGVGTRCRRRRSRRGDESAALRGSALWHVRVSR